MRRELKSIMMKSNEALQQEPLVNPQKNNHTSRLAWKLTFCIFLITLASILSYWLYFRFHQTTDDAYVSGFMVNLTSQNPGTPIAFFADNTDYVEMGQILVLIDPTDFQITFEKREAELALAAQKVKELWETYGQKKALVDQRRVEVGRAQYNYNNRSGLVGTKAISQEDFIHSKDDYEMSQAQLAQAEHEMQLALASLGTTNIDELPNHPSIQTAKANLSEAFVNLKRCTILAPVSGYVGNRNVEVGQWINPNVPLMTIVPLDRVWIDANFKEGQLEDLRIGQTAFVSIDMYGSHIDFEGKVEGLTPGSGSVFSLLPPQNATGNWIKIVQRVPVRIHLNPEQIKKFPVVLGLSAYVNVDITDKKGERLSNKPTKRVVASTPVFEIAFKELDPIMQKIIENNLQITKPHPPTK